MRQAAPTTTQKAEAITRFAQSENCYLGAIYDCAKDNAGYDGQNLDLLDFPEYQTAIKAIYLHIDSIIDAQMLDYSQQIWTQAEALLKA